jgi:oligogalacturonide transport system permease protein
MKKNLSKPASYVFLILLAAFMIYPLLWLLAASFKQNQDIFLDLSLIPKSWTLDGYKNGWNSNGQYSYTRFFMNTFLMVIPTVLFTIVSSFLVAYGFARFKFFGKKVFFSLMLSTLMLPNNLIVISRYLLFRDFNWLNSYKPIIIPALFATYSFFIFMIVQFLRGIPRELDEAATIDGCGSFAILWRIILPLSKSVIFSAMIFQFVWRWNDFQNVLIYIDSVSKYPLALALRMSLDITESVNWNGILAMSVLSLVPPTLIFFFAQRYFVEGVATSGLKG